MSALDVARWRSTPVVDVQAGEFAGVEADLGLGRGAHRDELEAGVLDRAGSERQPPQFPVPTSATRMAMQSPWGCMV